MAGFEPAVGLSAEGLTVPSLLPARVHPNKLSVNECLGFFNPYLCVLVNFFPWHS